MAYAKVRGDKILILHSIRQGTRVKSLQLHVFDDLISAQCVLASAEDWRAFHASLQQLLDKGRIDEAKLKASLTDAIKKLQAKQGDPPLTASAKALTAMLQGFTIPLSCYERQALLHARTELTALQDTLETTLKILDTKEEDMTEETIATRADELLDEGLECHYGRGNWAAARELFQRGLASDPSHVDLLVHAGLCDYMEGKVVLAHGYFTKAATLARVEADALIARNPTIYVKEPDQPEDWDGTSLYRHHEFRPFFRSLTNKAMVEMELKRYHDALETLTLCCSYQVLDGIPNMIGECHLNLGDVDEADRWYGHLLWPESRYVKSLICYLLGDLERAFEHLLICIGWNPHIAEMITGTDRPEQTRYSGSPLPPRLEASEFMHRSGRIFKNYPKFKDVVRCVLDDPQIDDLLARLAEARQLRSSDKTYRMPSDLWGHFTGNPEAEFIAHHTHRIASRLSDPSTPYWFPADNAQLRVLLVEKKTQNWRVHLADQPEAEFFLRPTSPAPDCEIGDKLTVTIGKSWRYQRRLYVSGLTEARCS